MILKDVNELFTEDLRDPAFASGYLSITLEEDGVKGFLYALQKVIRAHGVSKVASDSEMLRESLYRSLSEKGNPGIKPLARVLNALGLRLAITPATTESAPADAKVEDQTITELTNACRLMAAELAAVRQGMQAQQAESEKLRAEVQQMVARMEHPAASVEDRIESRDDWTDRSSVYSFATISEQGRNSNMYQPDPFKSMRTGS